MTVDNQYNALRLAGVIFFFLAFLFYFVAHRKAGESISLATPSEWLRALLLHVRDERAPAWPHVAANLSICIAVCIFVGLFAAQKSIGLQVDNASIGLSVSALVLSILSTCATLWTLWQTQRIELSAGYSSQNFRQIVRAMSEQMERLARDITRKRAAGRQLDRVLIVAHQPFYGMLTFRDEREESLFTNALLLSARATHHGLKMRILCGDAAALNAFHENYYSSYSDKAALISSANARSKAMLDEVEREALGQVFVRTDEGRVSPTEFVIIGDTVYEFSIDTSSGRSVVSDTHIRNDPNAARRHAKVFELLEKAAKAEPSGSFVVTSSPLHSADAPQQLQ